MVFAIWDVTNNIKARAQFNVFKKDIEPCKGVNMGPYMHLIPLD